MKVMEVIRVMQVQIEGSAMPAWHEQGATVDVPHVALLTFITFMTFITSIT
jgi:hypothetical protein